MKKYEQPEVSVLLMNSDVIVSSGNGMVDDNFAGESNPWEGFNP